MIDARTPLADMISALKPLMADRDMGRDFVQPSMLREVPSLSSPDSDYNRAVREYAELGGSAFGNR